MRSRAPTTPGAFSGNSQLFARNNGNKINSSGFENIVREAVTQCSRPTESTCLQLLDGGQRPASRPKPGAGKSLARDGLLLPGQWSHQDAHQHLLQPRVLNLRVL